MANRFVSPQQQFINNAGQPYAGGFLYFYISGTSTPTNTYQDQGLTTPNLNPVALDSAGDAGNIFLDPGIVYKVVLTDASNNQIWTFDPVLPTDSSTSTGFNPVVSCTSSGTNTITLTPITPSQQPALYSNFQMFSFVPIASTTGPVQAQVGTLPIESVFVAPGVQAGSGTFVAGAGPYILAYGSLVAGASPGFLLINQNIGAIQASLPLTMPQGYLTLTSGTPIIPADVVAATQIYYTPLTGLGVPIHNGVSIISTLLAGELPLLLTSSQAASNIYDVYLAYNGNSPVIGTGPSWVAGTAGSITVGSCARGTGAGGAALARSQGIWTNAASISLIYNRGSGNTTITVPAGQGIYLGSIFIDSVAGQVSCYRSTGQSRKWGVWNAYNRQRLQIINADPNVIWTYSTAQFRQSDATAANFVQVFAGLPEETVFAEFVQVVYPQAAPNSSVTAQIGIGVNSITTPSGLVGVGQMQSSGFTGNTYNQSSAKASHTFIASIGVNQLNPLEYGQATCQFNGTSASMRLSALWNG